MRYHKFFLESLPRLHPNDHWATLASPTVDIPALDVPPPPSEQKPAPESASIQVLRGLLADRRAERDRVNERRQNRVRQIEEAEKRIADLRDRVGDDDRHLAAADAAITNVIADIEKLGGSE